MLQLTCSCILYKPHDDSVGSKFVAMLQTLLFLMKIVVFDYLICLILIHGINLQDMLHQRLETESLIQQTFVIILYLTSSMAVQNFHPPTPPKNEVLWLCRPFINWFDEFLSSAVYTASILFPEICPLPDD